MGKNSVPVNGKSQVVVVGNKLHHYWPKLALGVLAMGVIGGVVYAVVRFHDNYEHAHVCSGNSSLMNEASKNLQPSSAYKLAPIVQKILATPNYQKDPNCLYIVSTYYLNVNDPTTAQKYDTQFSKVYNGSNLSTSLSQYKSASQLSGAVKTSANTQKKNPYGYNFYGIP